MSLSERMLSALTKAKLSQSQLARMIGLKSPSVNAWVTGKTKSIEGEHLLRAAAALGVNANWLATGRGPMQLSSDQAQQQIDIHPGFTTLSVPDELTPLFEAWMALYMNRTIPPGFIDGALLMITSLNPTRIPPRVRSAKENQRSE